MLSFADVGSHVGIVEGIGSDAESFKLDIYCLQVLDFMAEFVQVPAVVVGNSIGSLASVMVSPAYLGHSGPGHSIPHIFVLYDDILLPIQRRQQSHRQLSRAWCF